MSEVIVSAYHPPAIMDRVTTPEEPGSPYSGALSYAYHFLGLGEEFQQRVTPQTALTYSAVWGCVRIIAQTLASIGWHVFERQERGAERLPITDNIAWTLGMQASPELTAFEWRQVMLKDALLWGNGYSEIERTNGGKILWLWRLDPAKVSVERDDNNRLFYRVRNEMGGDSFLSPSNVFHLKGLGPDGLVGYSIIEMARRSIELGLQEERFGSDFFKRGPMPGGVLKTTGKLSDEQQKALRDSFERIYGGTANAGRVVVLGGGLEFTPLSLPNDDAQFLESRTFQVSEICRWYGVPPHKLADLSRATFSNIEEQERSFVADCLLPWARRLESEADVKLYGSVSMGRRYTRLNLDALQRGNSTTQTDTVIKKVMGGIMKPNEGREYFDLNPDPSGDMLMVQGQMMPLERAIEEPPEPPPPMEEMEEEEEEEENSNGEIPKDVAAAFKTLLVSAYADLLRVEADKGRRARNKGQLQSWAAEFYNESSQERVAGVFRPIVQAFVLSCGGPLNVEEQTARLARLHNEAGKAAAEAGKIVNADMAKTRAAVNLNYLWKAIHETPTNQHP